MAIKKPLWLPELTLGTDPEVFAEQDGTVLPAPLWLPSKGEAQFDGIGPDDDWKITKIYWDGFQAELALNGGTDCIDILQKRLRAGLWRLNKELKTYFPDAKLTTKTVVEIPQDVMEVVPQHFVDFGCMPSFNAYDDKGKFLDNPRDLLTRFTGGHMHFSPTLWGTKHPKEEILIPVVKGLDAIIGVYTTAVAEEIDNPIRRKHYGLAGEFRLPKYGDRVGLEYRVPSSFWIASPHVMEAVWEIGRIAIRAALAPARRREWLASEAEVKEAINNSDVKLARTIIKRNMGILRSWLERSRKSHYHCVMPEGGRNFVIDLALHGMKEFVPMDDIEGTWGLKYEAQQMLEGYPMNSDFRINERYDRYQCK